MPPEEEKPKSPKRDWVDIGLKMATPLITGILLAGIGYYSNQTLRQLSENEETARAARADQAENARARLSSREESARLITQLQVQREQAETDLRKDVFDQALAALFNKNQDNGSFQDLSKRLLRLELLALNFGDSLSLSPLFNEFKRDLQYALSVNTSEADYDTKIGTLMKRLLGLAKRVASGQLSSLEQHGALIEFEVPLDRKKIEENDCPKAKKLLSDGNVYKWPEDVIEASIRINQEIIQQQDDGITQEELDKQTAYLRDFTKNIVVVDGVVRHISVSISNVDRCSKTITVNLSIEREDPPMSTHQGEPPSPKNLDIENKRTLEVEREFELDFYNFPIVDNTRLSNNHRFAIVMEDFNDKFLDDRPHIEVSGVIFPAEYASLRDRPGMDEAMELLQSALNPVNSPTPPENIQEKEQSGGME